MSRGKISVERSFNVLKYQLRTLLNNLGLFLNARKIFNNFKSKTFSLKNNQNEISTLEPTPGPTTDLTLFYIPKVREAQTKKSKHKISL